MNKVFGYLDLKATPSIEVRFEGCQVVSSPGEGASSSQVCVLASQSASVKTHFDPARQISCYLWGVPAHPQIPNSELAKWCSGLIATANYARFKELLGPFIVVAEEPAEGRVTFASDVLGIRPLFLGNFKGKLVFGSDAWLMRKAGWSSAGINCDAVASWVMYKFNATGTSLFSDLYRMPAGCVVVFQNGCRNDIPYAEFTPAVPSLTQEELCERIHELVSSAVKTLLFETPKIRVPLSGGYDSRYLLALALQFMASSSLECVNVPLTPSEGQVATRVALALGVPLKTIPAKESEWDLYDDEVYHFAPDGFPIEKQLAYQIAKRYPETPFLNGFLGGPLVRGVNDCFLGKPEPEWENPVRTLQEKLCVTSLDFFRKEVASGILRRSLTPMEKATQDSSRLGKASDWADFYYNQRLRMSNNFLQHLDLTETLLPFYDWRLLSLKIGHDYSLFHRTNYERLFRKYFPCLAELPHADDLPSKKAPRVGKCVKRWARQLLPDILQRDRLRGLNKKRCCLLALAAIAGDRRVEFSILTMKGLQFFEQSLRNVGWNLTGICLKETRTCLQCQEAKA